MTDTQNPGTAQSANILLMTRVFDAPLDAVWRAWTECEHLRHWFGPKGYTMHACKVDLRPGGMFHYGMSSPSGEVMWGKFVYRDVVTRELLTYVVSFSDEAAGILRHPLADNWPLEVLSEMTFTESGGKTTVTSKTYPVNASDTEVELFNSAHEQVRAGSNAMLDQLEKYLSKK